MKTKSYRLLLILLGSLLVYWVWWNSSSLVAPLHLQSHSISKFIVKAFLACIPMTVVLFLLHKPKEIVGSLGLNGSCIKGIGTTLVMTFPMFVGFSIIGNFNSEITVKVIIYKCVLAALFEEIVFRGFMFGQLFRYGKVGFFWAAFSPALLFGLWHIYQGHDLISSIMAFGVTFLGALYFSWIYVEWDYNLWMPIGLHFFMNLSWQLFIVDGNEVAAGGLISNVFRLSSIAVAIILTIVYKRKSGRRVFDYRVWAIR